MFNLRLRQAETAFAEGRLNEAARLVDQPGVRDHRHGQLLLTRIVDALVNRGQEHLRAGRLAEASADCEEARRLAGEQSSVAKLSSDLANASRDAQKQATRNHQVAVEVGREIARGELDLGEKLLARLEAGHPPTASVAGKMSDQIGVSRDRIDAAIHRARHEVEAGHTRQAVAAILNLQKLSPSHPELVDLIDQVTAPVVSELWNQIDAARLDRVADLIESVRPLVDFDPDLTEVSRAIEFAKEINVLLEAGRFSEAQLSIRQLTPLLRQVNWLSELADKLAKATDLIVEIQSSPLSLLDHSSGDRCCNQPDNQNWNSAAARSPNLLPLQDTSLPERLILQIDGVGSAMLLRQSEVSIGASGHSKRSDIELAGYPDGGSLKLDRRAGSYQMTAVGTRDVSVNEQPGRSRSLKDGDSVRIGRRCRFRFRRPSADVPSAVLELIGTRLSRPDIRSVVLFDETLVIGPGRSSHLLTANLDLPLILFVRDGVLYVRSGLPDRAQRFARNGDSLNAVPLQLNTPAEVGNSRITILPFTA